MGSASIFGMMCGIYHWYPKMFGRKMNETLGHIHFWLTIISAYCVFFPMHFLGLSGVPRRYYANSAYDQFDVFVDMNQFITVAAFVGGAAQLIFLWNFFSSIRNGKRSEQNPWHSNTLEWTAPVEHIHGNWPGEIPHVYRWAYDYSKPGAEQDFIPQNVPDEGQVDEMAEPNPEKFEPSRKVAPDAVHAERETLLFSAVKRFLGFAK
jgi:cytochrome c oxidase subunit 1